jgi:hypothetical protein
MTNFDQDGAFTSPVLMMKKNKKIMVLDSSKNTFI